MFKQVLIAAAFAAAISGGVAVAKDTTPSAADAPAPAPSGKTRYCLKSEAVTGTMLQSQSCRTLAQWKALGVDPTKKQR